MSFSTIDFNILDALVLNVASSRPVDLDLFACRYRRYRKDYPASPAKHALRLRFVPVIKDHAPMRLGREAVFGRRFFMVDRAGLRMVFDPRAALAGETLEVEEGFDREMLGMLLEPLMLLQLLRCGILPLHASSVASSGRSTAFCAWGGTGKTRAVLNLCFKAGFDFISDEWTLMSAGRVYPLRSEIALFDYDMAEFHAQIGLRSSERARLALSRQLRGAALRSLCSRLGLLLSCRWFAPERLFSRVSDGDAFGRICLLVTGAAQPSLEPLSGEKSAQMILANFRAELRFFLRACHLYTFSAVGEAFDEASWLKMYAVRLQELLCGADAALLTVPAVRVDTDLQTLLRG